MPRELSAGVVIFKLNGQTRFLLLKPKKSSQFWDLPKGNIERGEEESAAAIRETAEETGLEKVKLIDGFKERIHYFYRKKGEVIYKENVFFLAQHDNGEVRLSPEHVEYGWFILSEARERLRENSLRLLEKAERFLREKRIV